VFLHPFCFGTPGTGKFDNELIRLNLNPDDMGVDKDCVFDLSGLTEVISNGIGDEGFDLSCRNPANGAGLLRLAQMAGCKLENLRYPPTHTNMNCSITGLGRGSTGNDSHVRAWGFCHLKKSPADY
jgi:hypothetical protein